MEFKQIENQYWNSFYDQSEAIYKSDRDLPYHNDFKKYFYGLSNNSKILELACGVRCDGIEIARKEFEVYETDISEVAVAKAQKAYQDLKMEARGKFVVCDAENLPFQNNYFDASFIAASFHHLPDPIRALAEMKRVTKPGGYIILGVEPNAWPYFTLFYLLWPVKKLIRAKTNKKLNSIADDTTHGFTKRKLIQICRSSDLEIIKISRVKYLTEFYDSGIRLLSKLTFRKKGPNGQIQLFLCKIDDAISKIPILNLLNWHWNVVCQKK